MYLPINLNISQKRILFVGGGAVCLHKIAAVQKFTSSITIVSKEFLPEVNALGFTCIIKAYDEHDLDTADIVYACTNNTETNKQIYADAKRRGLLINVADNPALCDFISPAVHTQGNITVAVSSGGTDVKKAVGIRNMIREFLTEHLY